MANTNTGLIGNSESHSVQSSGPDPPAPVIGLTIYSDYTYIYAITLNWHESESPNTYTYGNTSYGTANTSTFTTPPISQIIYYLDETTDFVGVEMYDWNNGGEYNILSCGNTAPAQNTAFSDEDDKFQDIDIYWKNVSGYGPAILGICIYFYDPNLLKMFRSPSEMAFPALGLMANAMVVAKSLKKVSKLRSQLNVKASNGEPPTGTDPNKVALWNRTVRAQESCKEFFLLAAPAIVVAACFGREAFGSWVPKTVGALSLVGAFFRYRYMKASIADSETRGRPFRNALWSMKAVHYLAVASCGYLVGKELYSHCKDNLVGKRLCSHFKDHYGHGQKAKSKPKSKSKTESKTETESKKEND